MTICREHIPCQNRNFIKRFNNETLISAVSNSIVNDHTLCTHAASSKETYDIRRMNVKTKRLKK